MMRSVLFFLLPVLFLVGVGMISYSFFRAQQAGANISYLYPTVCEGGFSNPSFAEGNVAQEHPDTYFIGVHNAAVLEGNTQAELHCGKFVGDVPANSSPSSVKVKFSWLATYDKKVLEQVPLVPQLTDASSTSATSSVPVVTLPLDEQGGESLQAPMQSSGGSSGATPLPIEHSVDASTTLELFPETNTPTSTEALPPVPVQPQDVTPTPLPDDEVSAVVPPVGEAPGGELPIESSGNTNPSTVETNQAAVPEVIPPPAEQSVSFLDQLFFKKAFAQEASLDLLNASNSSSTIVSTSTEVELFSEEILKATTTPPQGGIVEVLFSVSGSLFTSLGFVTKEEFSSAEFLLPIGSSTVWNDLRDVKIAIRSAPTIDGVAPIILVDGLWLEAAYGDYPEDPHPIPSEHRGDVFRGIAVYGDYAAVVVDRRSTFATTTATTTELWLRDDTASSTPSWMFIANETLFPAGAKVFFRYGLVFWQNGPLSVWVFNPKTNAFDSQSWNEGEFGQYYFRDEAGDKKILTISSVDGSFAFEDEIPEAEQ